MLQQRVALATKNPRVLYRVDEATLAKHDHDGETFRLITNKPFVPAWTIQQIGHHMLDKRIRETVSLNCA